MALVCSTQYYILGLVDGETNLYHVWDKINKTTQLITYSSVSDFYELNDGSIIDVVQTGSFVALVIKADPTSLIFLPSTSGDYYNTLLSATVTGGILTITMYAMTANETTVLTYAMQTDDGGSPPVSITPCFNDFNLTTGTIIKQWCDGFTLNQVIYYTSPEGVQTLQTENSVLCGYVAPAGPFRITEEKIIEYRNCIYRNPVFFIWKNTLGGWDSYLFDRNQVEDLETTSLGSFASDYTRIGDITNPETEIGKEARGRITYFADNITLQEKIGLKQLLISNKVYIWAEGEISREVKVLPGSFLIQETKKYLHQMSFEIMDVPINTIKN